jgi:hypothetical protein
MGRNGPWGTIPPKRAAGKIGGWKLPYLKIKEKYGKRIYP